MSVTAGNLFWRLLRKYLVGWMLLLLCFLHKGSKELIFCSSANSSLHSFKISTVLLLIAHAGDDGGKLKLFHFRRTRFCCSSFSISGENSTDFCRGIEAVLLVLGPGIRVLGLCLASILLPFSQCFTCKTLHEVTGTADFRYG